MIIAGEEKIANSIRTGGVEIAGGPHHSISWEGAGVTVTDKGNGEVEVNIPEATGGAGAPAAGYYIEVPSGNWLAPLSYNQYRTTTAQGGEIQCYPFIIPTNMTFDRIATKIDFRPPGVGTTNGESFRAGVYDTDPTTLKPKNKLIDALSTFSIGGSSLAPREQAITPTALTPGLDWFAFLRTPGIDWNLGELEVSWIDTTKGQKDHSMHIATGGFSVPPNIWPLFIWRLEQSGFGSTLPNDLGAVSWNFENSRGPVFQALRRQ
jgi:hypothetical protein